MPSQHYPLFLLRLTGYSKGLKLSDVGIGVRDIGGGVIARGVEL